MVKEPELASALDQWLREAVELLSSDSDYSAEVESPPNWRIDRDGELRFCSRSYLRWTGEAIQATFALNSAEAGKAAMERVPAIADQLGRVVRAEDAGGTPLTVESILGYLLPRPYQIDSYWASQEFFAEKYEHLETYLLSNDALRDVHLWILGGVKFDTSPIGLAEGVHLDRMNDSELANAFNFDLVSHMFPRELAITPDLYECYRTCIRFTRSAGRLIGDSVSRDAAKRSQEVLDVQERVRQTLVLSGLDDVVVTGHLAFTTGELSVGGWRYAKLNATQRIRFPTTSSNSRILAVQRAWGLLATVPEKKRGNGLNLAIRRLSFLTDRSRLEDRILDLMIAAEAFYLTGLDKTTELSYRLALRGAVLKIQQGSTAVVARSVYELLRSAYDVRSKVAHGADLNSHLAKKGLTADVFVERLTTVIREAIVGVLQDFARGDINGWPPDWEGDLFALLGQGITTE